MPLVSVISPAYNASESLLECVESVLGQTYQNFELIIVDDGSKDDTLKMAEALSRQDSRIRVVSQKNSGSCVARNAGFRLAKGKYVSTIDADDLWPSWRLEDQITILEENPGSIVIGGVHRFEVADAGRVWTRATYPFPYLGKEDFLVRLITAKVEYFPLFNTFCAEKTIILDELEWDSSFKTGHDWEAWIRLAKKYRFICADKIYLYYRKSDKTTTRKNSKRFMVDYHIKVLEKHAVDVFKSEDKARQAYSDRLLDYGRTSYYLGKLDDSFYCIRKAFQYSPLQSLFDKRYVKLIAKHALCRLGLLRLNSR